MIRNSARRLTRCADDDYAVSIAAKHVNNSADDAFFLNRSMTTPFTIFNNATGFMEARDASGDWAGQDAGWTEGDMWAYSFDVVHAVDKLIAARGGKAGFVRSLDEHFDGGGQKQIYQDIIPHSPAFPGHNDQTNEPSHHIPYLYALAGAASTGQERIRNISSVYYNNTVNGLAGVRDAHLIKRRQLS